MDFDPRDYTDERDPRHRDERDRDDADALTMARGSSSHREEHHDERRDTDNDRDRVDHRDSDDVRWAARERDPRERGR